MEKNLLDKLLEDLDLVYEEKFKIKTYGDNVFMFVKSMGLVYAKNKEVPLTNVLNDIMTIPNPIEKIAFMPTIGDKYHYVNVTGTIKDAIWNNSLWDYTLYDMGNCFESYDMALSCKIRVLNGPIFKIKEKHELDRVKANNK